MRRRIHWLAVLPASAPTPTRSVEGPPCNAAVPHTSERTNGSPVVTRPPSPPHSSMVSADPPVCCAGTGHFMRSAEMEYVTFQLQEHLAHDTIERLGELGAVQVRASVRHTRACVGIEAVCSTRTSQPLRER